MKTPRAKKYFDQIEEEDREGYMASINLSEFYYKTCQKLGKITADIRYYQIRRTKLRIVETDEDLSRTAALEKCRRSLRPSLADCYALGLAKRFKSTILTTDRDLAKVKDVRSILFEV